MSLREIGMIWRIWGRDGGEMGNMGGGRWGTWMRDEERTWGAWES